MTLYIFVISMILYVNVWVTHGLPQSFDDPKKFFEPIDFDKRHTGSYLITDCVKELINCWEFIKIDYVCGEDWYIYDSVCGIYYTECDENTGFQENPYIKLYEGFCRYY